MIDIEANASRHRTCLVTTTYYPDLNDIRLGCAIDLCRLAAQHKFHVFIVDDSPDEMVRRQLQDASEVYVHVLPQEKAQYSGKGGALRQAIRTAIEWFYENNVAVDESVIVFTEPEKINIIEHVNEIVLPLLVGDADVVVPARNDNLFRETYPIEQYHSESYGNLYFNLLAKQLKGFQQRSTKSTPVDETKLDWLFGPFAFKTNLANSWLQYDGTSWDAQMIPYVRGVRMQGWKIISVPINYVHSLNMKQQEEGDPIWVAKRLHQLNLLFDLLGKNELTP